MTARKIILPQQMKKSAIKNLAMLSFAPLSACCGGGDFINNGDGTFRGLDNPILFDAQFGMASALGDLNGIF